MTESHVAAGPRPLGASPSDYAVLKRRIREAGLLKKEPAYYVRLIVLNTIALAACCESTPVCTKVSYRVLV